MICIPARPHPFPLDPQRCALLVIDMQNDFCDPDGYSCAVMGMEPEAVRGVIPPIARMLAWARARQIFVVFTKETHAPDLSDVAPSKSLRYRNAGHPVGAVSPIGRFLIRGEGGTRIVNELRPLPGELQVNKPAHSAFISTDLDHTLRTRGVTHLLVTGVKTEGCVLETYRNGSDLGYFALLLEDCCGAFAPDDHAAAINVLVSEAGAIGWVTTSDAFLAHAPGSQLAS